MCAPPPPQSVIASYGPALADVRGLIDNLWAVYWRSYAEMPLLALLYPYYLRLCTIIGQFMSKG